MSRYYQVGYDDIRAQASFIAEAMNIHVPISFDENRVTCTVCKKSRPIWVGFYSNGNVEQNLTCTECYENYRLQGVMRTSNLCGALGGAIQWSWTCDHKGCDREVRYALRESNGYDRIMCKQHGDEFKRDNPHKISKLKNNSRYMFLLLQRTKIFRKGCDYR